MGVPHPYRTHPYFIEGSNTFSSKIKKGPAGPFLNFGREGGIVGHFPVPYPTDSLRSQKIVPDNFFEPLILLSRVRMFFKLNKQLTAIFLHFSNNGGEGGFRTLDRYKPIHTFQACAFSHSATSPKFFYNSNGAFSRSAIVHGCTGVA